MLCGSGSRPEDTECMFSCRTEGVLISDGSLLAESWKRPTAMEGEWKAGCCLTGPTHGPSPRAKPNKVNFVIAITATASTDNQHPSSQQKPQTARLQTPTSEITTTLPVNKNNQHHGRRVCPARHLLRHSHLSQLTLLPASQQPSRASSKPACKSAKSRTS